MGTTEHDTKVCSFGQALQLRCAGYQCLDLYKDEA
jgi:hypothetical protein